MPEAPIAADVLIIGAGASGLMCASEAGRRGRRVIVLDHARRPGTKILMSGGGRCNFTNLDVSAGNYISHNPHFCKSALARYSQRDFIAMVDRHRIPYHERDHGQLFCDDSAWAILAMLLAECTAAQVTIRTECRIERIAKAGDAFAVETSLGPFQGQSLVVASGGLSIPRIGASPLGYRVAAQFGHHVWPTAAGLVPLTLQPGDKALLAGLSGIAVDAIVANARSRFRGNILFTHRGLSGPAILQVSSYWRPGEPIDINLLPDIDVVDLLKTGQATQPMTRLKTALGKLLPKRLLLALLGRETVDSPLQAISHAHFGEIARLLQHWPVTPGGTEGYRTAEVTLGGVDCHELSSRTMESRKVAGLYFIGEVVDVTGWLGGYNLQWAWSSGWCAGQVV